MKFKLNKQVLIPCTAIAILFFILFFRPSFYINNEYLLLIIFGIVLVVMGVLAIIKTDWMVSEQVYPIYRFISKTAGRILIIIIGIFLIMGGLLMIFILFKKI